MSMGSSTKTFEKFLQGWLERQDQLLEQLTSAQRKLGEYKEEEEELKKLVSSVLALHQEYYEEKSRAAERHAFGMFAPSWCSPLECAFLWIGGFKPTALVHVVFVYVHGLSPEQIERVQSLKDATKKEERILSDELAQIQESAATSPITEAAKRVRLQLAQGMDGMVAGESLDNLKLAMQVLVAKADMLRTHTAARIVEILTLPQCVKFLVAATQIQRYISFWTPEDI